MLILGLTGGIATGKSTVSRRLQELGIPIIDADLIAREVVLPDKPAYKRIVAAFDVPDLLNNDKTLNRAALGSHVFGHPERLAKLNAIVHPAVKKEIVWQIVRAYVQFHRMVVLDVPLLFESGLDRICGLTVAVFSSPQVQLARLLERNPELSQEEAQKRIDSQMSTETRNYRADIVIENSGTVEDLYGLVDATAEKVRPGFVRTLVEYVPPVGVFVGLVTVVVRLLRDRLRGSEPKKKSD